MRIGFRVKILANLIEKEIRASSAIEDMMKMTNMHGRIISFLHRNEDKDIYQRDIEQNFMISGPSVSEVLKLMKKNGLIEKKSVDSWTPRCSSRWIRSKTRLFPCSRPRSFPRLQALWKSS